MGVPEPVAEKAYGAGLWDGRGVLVGVLEGAGLGFLPYSPPEESPQDNSDRFGKMNRINITQKRQVQGRPHPVADFGGVKAGRGHRDMG